MGLGSLPDDAPHAPPPAKHPLNLQTLLVPRPNSTVLLRVSGTSMRDAGIGPGDLVVVDRSLRPRPGQIVVARLAEGFTLKQLAQQAGQLVLQPANPAFPVLPLAPGEEPQLWGVALHVIRRLA
ncbi:LexA family transcriptional regulator [Synechococcus sp. FGCU-3]|jgi:DNA polymerase V|nr:LexA family transcriptional regulator [Synechococcus sp. FGCU3]